MTDLHSPALVIAIEQAIGWFQGYAENHGAKGTPEGDIKAQTNWDRAAYLGHALNTRAPVAAPTGDAVEGGHGAILQEIAAEVENASTNFPLWPTRIIDAGNVVSEEAGELAKACLQVTYEKHKETLDGVRVEAIQTAAMCVRFLASMDRYDTEPGAQHDQKRALAAVTGKDAT